MKNLRIIIAFITLLAFSTACEKWVEFDPHDEYSVTEADYLQTESDYRTMTISCYTPTQWLNQMINVGDIPTDNAVAGGENASDVLVYQNMDDYAVNTNNSVLEDLWKSAYEGINRTNYLTQYKDANSQGETVTFEGKDEMYGEIYFLRAYYYFNLVRMFGDVVLFTDRKLGVSDFGTLERSPKADVYAQIELDLSAAIAVLPTSTDQAGRATKYAAQALLGKVLLYQEKFDEAAVMLENVISGPFSLVPDFASIFLPEGENGPESVFEVQYSAGFPYWNWGGTTRGQGNHAVQQCGVRGINGTPEMPFAAGWSTNLPTQDLYSAYADGDQRREATLFDPEAYKLANPDLNVSYSVAPFKNTGLYNMKYLPRIGHTSGQPELNYDNNQRTIRFADVLLMAAEAYNRASSPDDVKAQNYLNMVRERAFGDNLHNITLTGEALKLAIWKERRLELAMEGDRLFDLIRTGQAANVIEGFVVGKNELFPIPQKEIEISGLTQNPNW